MNIVMERIKISLNLLKDNFIRTSIAVAIIKVVSLILLKNVSGAIFNMLLLDANLQGITNENFVVLFKNPIALVLVFVMIALVCVFMLFEMILLILYFNHSYDDTHVSFKVITYKIKKLFKPSFIWFALYVLIIMPNMNLGISASFAANIRVPRFIIDAVYEQKLLTILYVVTLVLLFVANLFLFYAPVIYVLEDVSFMKACRKSYEMTRHNLVRILLIVGSVTLITFLLTLGLTLGIGLLDAILSLLLPVSPHLVRAISTTTLFFLVLVVISFSQIFTYELLLVSYHDEMDHQVLELKERSNHKKSLKYGFIIILIIGVLVTAGVYAYDLNDPLPNETLIISHRGESKKAIENTLEALEMASTYGVDFVEMDVQLTQDEEVIVYHDFNLKRLTGDKRKVSEVSFEEIADMKISKGKMSSRIPSFKEYMILAKSLDQKILVELKPDSRHSKDFIHKVVSIVEELEMEEMVYYQSLDKQIILDLKEAYPDSIAGYIIGFNLGKLEYLDVDFYSLEASAVSKKTVNTLNLWNKGLFVWTVNDTNGLMTFLDMRVAGMITDIPEMAIVEKEISPSMSIIDRVWALLP